MFIFQILQIRLKTTLGSSLEQFNVDQYGLVWLIVVYRGETSQIEIFLSYLSCMKRNMKPSRIIRRKQWQQLWLVVLLVVLVGSGRPGSADRIYAVLFFFFMYYTAITVPLLPRTYYNLLDTVRIEDLELVQRYFLECYSV